MQTYNAKAYHFPNNSNRQGIYFPKLYISQWGISFKDYCVLRPHGYSYSFPSLQRSHYNRTRILTFQMPPYFVQHPKVKQFLAIFNVSPLCIKQYSLVNLKFLVFKAHTFGIHSLTHSFIHEFIHSFSFLPSKMYLTYIRKIFK